MQKLKAQTPPPAQPSHPTVIALAQLLARVALAAHNGAAPEETPTNDNDPRRHLRQV